MYFASLEASMELAKVEGPYSTYEGSPMSRGVIQPGNMTLNYTEREATAAFRHRKEDDPDLPTS